MILFVIILLFGFATGESVLYRMSYFLALLAVGGYVWTRLSLSRLHMWVRGQTTVAQVGDVLEVSMSVFNGLSIPTGLVEIVHLSDIPGHVCGSATRIPAKGYKEWTTQSVCHARGVYHMGPLVARSSDPLGLFRVEKTEGDGVEVAIQPPIVELPYFRLPVAGFSGDARVFHSPETRSPHAAAVREYSHGDSLNRIHWASTARYGHLMSKEFDSGGPGDVWIVVDLELDVQQVVGTDKTDEYGVAAAASLAHLALTEERSVGLIAYGDQDYVLPPGSGARQMSRVLNTLTRAKPEGHTSLAELLSRNAAKLSRSVSLIVITSSCAAEWVSVLQNMTRGGINVAVVVVDPVSFEGDQSCSEVLVRLLRAGIPAHIVVRRDSLTLALARPTTLYGLPYLSEAELAS